MLISTQTLRVPFVCTDATGAAVAPTGTPTATLYKNGAAQVDVVTVTMSGADGLASVTVTGSQGDCFYFKILATISGVVTPQFSLPVYLSKLPAGSGDAMTLTSGERTAVANEVEAQIIDDTDSEKVLQAITNKIAAANPSLAGLTLAAIASQVRTELATELARIDVAISTRLATIGYTAPTTPPTAAENASAVRTELATELGRIDATIGSRSAPGAAMTLTSGERTAVANEVEAQIIDDTDSEKVLQAITNKIASANPSLAGLTLAAIASQVRTELATELARIDVAISTRLATGGYTAPPLASSIAALILSNPANKLATNASGYVTSTNGGGGGSGTQLVVPIVTEGGSRLSSQPVTLFIDEQIALKLLAKDTGGEPRDLTGLSLEFRMSRPPASVRTLADLRAFELTVSGHDDWLEVDAVLDLDGNADGEVEFDIPEFLTKQPGPLSCSLRDSTDGETISKVYVVVMYAA